MTDTYSTTLSDVLYVGHLTANGENFSYYQMQCRLAIDL